MSYNILKDGGYSLYFLCCVVGSLMYDMVCIRPNIAQVVKALSLFMGNPRCEHWVTMKRIFTYFLCTSKYSIFYHNHVLGDQLSLNIHGYVDFDRKGDVHRRRFTTECVSIVWWTSELDEQVTSCGHLVHYKDNIYDSYSCL